MDNIEIKETHKSIQAGFRLDDLKDLNIVIGKNNSGKTTLFEAIESNFKEERDIRVVYIRSKEVEVKEEFKTTTKSSLFIKNLSNICQTLGHSVSVPDDLKICAEEISNKTKERFKEITGEEVSTNIIANDNIDIEVVLQNVIKNDIKEIEKQGQGYQRLYIASLLKACIDYFKDEDIKTQLLILFEEPEVFLHPSLKKELNDVLVSIANQNKYQVFISTHDPYFLHTNLGRDNVKILPLTIEDGKCKLLSPESTQTIDIADEMLHIALFTKLMEKTTNDGIVIDESSNLGRGMNELSSQIVQRYNGGAWATKSYQLNGTSYNVILPIFIRNAIHHPENTANTFTEEELMESTKILFEILN